jgi:hypothetical protein
LVEQGGTPEKSSGRRGLTTALVLIALLGLSAFAWGRLRAADQATAEPKAATPQAPQPAAGPTRVSVTFQVTPAEAKLYLDGEPLPSNPTTKLILADGTAHALRAEAAGFADSTREFSPTKDMMLELALMPIDRGNSATPSGSASASVSEPPSGGRRAPHGGRSPIVGVRPAPSPAAPTPAAATPPAATKPNCDSPFFLDKDGIRRVRPECR